jgi:CHRD domain
MIHHVHLTRSLGSVAVLGVAIIVFLSGCGTSAKGAGLQSATGATEIPSAIGVAGLHPQPSGQAELTWDPTTNNTLTTSLTVIGLSPTTQGGFPTAAYPGEIGDGTCQQPGKDLYPLAPLKSDQYGEGTSTTSVKGVAGGIPATGWHLALHNPAQVNQGAQLSCANIINPTPSATEKQTVKLWLNGMMHQHGAKGAFGGTRLSLTGTTLTVYLSIEGLAPGSKHAAHIHSGSCARQGPVVYNLETITADANGRARVETTIKNVKGIADDWYVNVHTSNDLTTQGGFQPIACGNVFVRS